MKKQIVIAQRGWVFIGNVTQIGTNIRITNCKNIRRWGTTKGLGELAAAGPTDNTKFDEYGTVELHELSVIARIEITTDRWKL
jgi:hypothetical protein